MKNISNSVSIATSRVIAVVNTKGGSAKSTTTTQVGGAYALDKELSSKIWEFDDENKDSQNFTKSAIQSEQIEVGDGAEITTTLRDLFTYSDVDIKLFDVGGNKTTTIFLEGLKKSRMITKQTKEISKYNNLLKIIISLFFLIFCFLIL